MPSEQKQIAIITDDPGWHGRQLRDLIAQRGYTSRFLSLTDCALIMTPNTQNNVHLPNFNDPPMGVFVRGIPGGSLEQIIFRLNILHALQNIGITVYNTPKSIERTVDKAYTSILLCHANLPTPPTWVCESNEQAQAIYNQEIHNGHQLILKPLFGSQGQGISLLNAEQGLNFAIPANGVYYLQRYIQKQANECTDIRVFVIDGIAKAAMLRRGKTWLTNRAQGADCEFLPLDKTIATLAEAVCKIINIHYAGVDLIQDQYNQFQIIEVNSIPAWYGLQQVTNFNIASCLIDSFLNHITHTDAHLTRTLSGAEI